MGISGLWGHGDATRTGRDTEDHGHHEERGLGELGDIRTTGMGPVGTKGHEDHGDDDDTGTMRKLPPSGQNLNMRTGAPRGHWHSKGGTQGPRGQ